MKRDPTWPASRVRPLDPIPGGHGQRLQSTPWPPLREGITTIMTANEHQRGPITAGLVYDVFKVLDAHGYQCGDDSAVGAAVILLGDLVDGYEGRINSARVPRGTNQSRELRADADQLRELLGAIADVLDVPLGDDVDAGLRLTRDRAILVRHAARDAAEMPLTLTEAWYLRSQVAAHAPDPKDGAE